MTSMDDTPEKVYFEPTQSIEHEVKSTPLQPSENDATKDATEIVTENVTKDIVKEVVQDVTSEMTVDVAKDTNEDSSSDSGLKSEYSKEVSPVELTVEDEVEDITSSRIDVRCKDPTAIPETEKSEVQSEVTNVSGANENAAQDVTSAPNQTAESDVTKDVTTNLESSSKAATPTDTIDVKKLSDSATSVTNVEANVTNLGNKDETLSADTKSESSALNQQQVHIFLGDCATAGSETGN